MAAPVGHMLSALLLIKSGIGTINDPQAFLAGASFPDIRYISKVRRDITHHLSEDSLGFVLKAPTSFEQGRRFHAWVDLRREEHMRKHDAYRFVQNGPLKTQMLKLTEDHILFDRLKGEMSPMLVFGKIYDEERSYALKDEEILGWHSLLKTYLDQTSFFNFTRYLRSVYQFQKSFGLPQGFFSGIWQSIKTLGFFMVAYFQIEKISREKKLREIILDFYDHKINELIKAHAKKIEREKHCGSVRAPPYRKRFV